MSAISVVVEPLLEIVLSLGLGPALTKRSLLLAGEIKPEGKTSARVIDKPREHISIH